MLGSGIIYPIEWTTASVPINIPISLRSGIRVCARDNPKTRAKIGKNKRNQRTFIACSPVNLTVSGEKARVKERIESTIKKYQIYFWYFLTRDSIGSRNVLIVLIIILIISLYNINQV